MRDVAHQKLIERGSHAHELDTGQVAPLPRPVGRRAVADPQRHLVRLVRAGDQDGMD